MRQLADHVERFWANTCYAGDCIVWTGNTANGYGRFEVNGRAFQAHRYIYEVLNGPVAVRIELDHLCRNRCCVNPGHLEPVTKSTNILRGLRPIMLRQTFAAITQCPRGHEYLPENTRIQMVRGYPCRKCRQCERDRYRNSRG